MLVTRLGLISPAAMSLTALMIITGFLNLTVPCLHEIKENTDLRRCPSLRAITRRPVRTYWRSPLPQREGASGGATSESASWLPSHP